MKIDFEMLQKMVDAGASGSVVLAFLREQDARKAPRREADRTRKRSGKKRNAAETVRKVAENCGDDATLTDTPRARLFREGKAILESLNVSERRAGGLLAQWLKITNDDDQLVMAAIVSAQNKVVPDAPGYILATIRGKLNERSGSVRADSGAQQSGSAAVLAGVAAAAERRSRERSAAGQYRQASGDADPAERPDPEFFGTR